MMCQQFILFYKQFNFFVMFSVSPGQIHIAINRKKRCEMCQKISPNTYFMYLRLAYENTVKSTIHLLHNTLKIDVVRFSVSPGHIYIALYRKIKFRMRLKYHQTMISNLWDWHMKTIPGPQLIIFHKTLKMIYASFSVSPGHIYDAIYSQIKCKMNMKLPPNTNFIYLGLTFENKDKSTTIYSIS